jgi:hypothetical protein
VCDCSALSTIVAWFVCAAWSVYTATGGDPAGKARKQSSESGSRKVVSKEDDSSSKTSAKDASSSRKGSVADTTSRKASAADASSRKVSIAEDVGSKKAPAAESPQSKQKEEGKKGQESGAAKEGTKSTSPKEGTSHKKKKSKPGTPVFLFYIAHRREESDQANTASGLWIDFIKQCAREWNSLSPEEKKPFYDQAAETKDKRYRSSKKAGVGSREDVTKDGETKREGPVTRSASMEKTAKESSCPSFLFFNEFRNKMKDADLTAREVAVLSAERWKEMTEEQRKPYIKQCAKTMSSTQLADKRRLACPDNKTSSKPKRTSSTNVRNCENYDDYGDDDYQDLFDSDSDTYESGESDGESCPCSDNPK